MLLNVVGWLTKDILEGRRPRRFPPDVMKRAERKLALIAAAAVLEDLRQPPGNRLHALQGDREGFHAIAINDVLCFDGPSEAQKT